MCRVLGPLGIRMHRVHLFWNAGFGCQDLSFVPGGGGGEAETCFQATVVLEGCNSFL